MEQQGLSQRMTEWAEAFRDHAGQHFHQPLAYSLNEGPMLDQFLDRVAAGQPDAQTREWYSYAVCAYSGDAIRRLVPTASWSWDAQASEPLLHVVYGLVLRPRSVVLGRLAAEHETSLAAMFGAAVPGPPPPPQTVEDPQLIAYVDGLQRGFQQRFGDLDARQTDEWLDSVRAGQVAVDRNEAITLTGGHIGVKTVRSLVESERLIWIPDQYELAVIVRPNGQRFFPFRYANERLQYGPPYGFDAWQRGIFGSPGTHEAPR